MNETRKPKILLLGHGRHGKDTVAEILRDDYGFTLVSSSWFAAERVMMPYFGSTYANVEECFADRHNGENRAIWYNQIQAYNSPDKARLAREILEVADIYVGMRSAAEFAVARDLFDLIIWVDASGRGMPLEGRDSFDIDQEPGMFVIENNGSLEDLKEIIRENAAALGITPLKQVAYA